MNQEHSVENVFAWAHVRVSVRLCIGSKTRGACMNNHQQHYWCYILASGATKPIPQTVGWDNSDMSGATCLFGEGPCFADLLHHRDTLTWYCSACHWSNFKTVDPAFAAELRHHMFASAPRFYYFARWLGCKCWSWWNNWSWSTGQLQVANSSKGFVIQYPCL